MISNVFFESYPSQDERDLSSSMLRGEQLKQNSYKLFNKINAVEIDILKKISSELKKNGINLIVVSDSNDSDIKRCCLFQLCHQAVKLSITVDDYY